MLTGKNKPVCVSTCWGHLTKLLLLLSFTLGLYAVIIANSSVVYTMQKFCPSVPLGPMEWI